MFLLCAVTLLCPCIYWGMNPLIPPRWGTNLRGGTTCFVACQKQSLPAHYITAHRAFIAVTHWVLRGGGRGGGGDRAQESSILLMGKDKKVDESGLKQTDAHVGRHGLFLGNYASKLLQEFPPQDARFKWITTLFRECCPHPSPVLCTSPPVPSLFCLGTGGCQTGFMSSSLELKEVSFVSCYGTRRLCLSGVMRSESGWAGWSGSRTIPWRRPAVRKSKRLLCRCCRLRVW